MYKFFLDPSNNPHDLCVLYTDADDKEAKMTDRELEQIYNDSYRSVYWTAMSLMKDEEEAEDIVQDTFVTLIDSYDTLTDKKKVLPWLKKIAANKSLNRLTRKRTVNCDDEFLDNAETVPEDFLPDSIIESDEKRKILMDIIDRSLSEDVRRTIILFYFDEMTTEEISEAMGIPQGTVLSRLNFARKKIKKEVEKYEKDNDDRLFAMALPFLSKLFIKEAEQVPMKPMPASLIRLSASEGAPHKGGASKYAAVSKAAATKGTGTMLKKVIIGIASLAILGGATAGVLHVVGEQDTDMTAGTDVTTTAAEGSEGEASDPSESELTNQTEETADENGIPAGGYVKYTYTTDSDTGIRFLSGEMIINENEDIVENTEYDQEGNITMHYKLEYDEDQDLVRTDYYDEDGELKSYVTFEYGEFGTSDSYHYSIGTDGQFYNSMHTEYIYDDQGRITGIYTYSIQRNELSSRTEYEYNDDGTSIEYMYTNGDDTEPFNYRIMNADGACIESHYPASDTRPEEEVTYFHDDIYERYSGDTLTAYGEFELDEDNRPIRTTNYNADGEITSVIEYEYVYY